MGSKIRSLHRRSNRLAPASSSLTRFSILALQLGFRRLTIQENLRLTLGGPGKSRLFVKFVYFACEKRYYPCVRSCVDLQYLCNSLGDQCLDRPRSRFVVTR